MTAGCAPEKISMRVAVCRDVAADEIALRIDAVALGESCRGNIDGDEGPIVLNEGVLTLGLIVVETNNVSFGIYAGDPSEGRAGKVDGAELSVGHGKSVQQTIAVDVGPHNSGGVDDHGGESS